MRSYERARGGGATLSRNRLIAVVALVVVATVVVRVAAVLGKTTIEHDEGISYLAASAHLEEWVESTDEGGLTGRWVPASEWQALLEPDRAFAFGEISAELASFDIHPPLYFWLLHVWMLVWGAGVATGAWLNVVVAAVTSAAIFGLALEVLGPRGRESAQGRVPREAAVVALVWSLNPAALQATVVARQYELLALASVLFVWALARVLRAERPSTRGWVIVASVTIAGLLVHYHFALVLVAGGVYVAWRAWQGDRSGSVPRYAAVAVASVLVLCAVQPGIWSAFARESEQAQPYEAAAFDRRVDATLDALSETVGWSSLESLGPAEAAAVLPGSLVLWRILYGGVLVGVAAAVIGTRTGRRAVASGVCEFASGGLVAVTVLVTLVGTLGLYLAFVSPVHAMGGRYLATTLPFAAFVPVLLARGLPARAGSAVLLAVCIVLLAASAKVIADVRSVAPPAVVEEADHIVLDNPRRGVAPRYLMHIRSDAAVFLATQQVLLEDPGLWTDELGPGDAYVGHVEYEATQAGRTAVVEVMRSSVPYDLEFGTAWPRGRYAMLSEQREGQTP